MKNKDKINRRMTLRQIEHKYNSLQIQTVKLILQNLLKENQR